MRRHVSNLLKWGFDNIEHALAKQKNSILRALQVLVYNGLNIFWDKVWVENSFELSTLQIVMYTLSTYSIVLWFLHPAALDMHVKLFWLVLLFSCLQTWKKISVYLLCSSMPWLQVRNTDSEVNSPSSIVLVWLISLQIKVGSRSTELSVLPSNNTLQRHIKSLQPTL